MQITKRQILFTIRKPFVVVYTLEEITSASSIFPIMGGILTKNAMEGFKHQVMDN